MNKYNFVVQFDMLADDYDRAKNKYEAAFVSINQDAYKINNLRVTTISSEIYREPSIDNELRTESII